jgi:hypothetical protein
MQDGYQKKIHIDELKFIVTNVLGYPQMQNRMKNPCEEFLVWENEDD